MKTASPSVVQAISNKVELGWVLDSLSRASPSFLYPLMQSQHASLNRLDESILLLLFPYRSSRAAFASPNNLPPRSRKLREITLTSSPFLEFLPRFIVRKEEGVGARSRWVRRVPRRWQFTSQGSGDSMGFRRTPQRGSWDGWNISCKRRGCRRVFVSEAAAFLRLQEKGHLLRSTGFWSRLFPRSAPILDELSGSVPNSLVPYDNQPLKHVLPSSAPCLRRGGNIHH